MGARAGKDLRRGDTSTSGHRPSATKDGLSQERQAILGPGIVRGQCSEWDPEVGLFETRLERKGTRRVAVVCPRRDARHLRLDDGSIVVVQVLLNEGTI